MFILTLLFLIVLVFHTTNNCDPTLAPPCICSKCGKGSHKKITESSCAEITTTATSVPSLPVLSVLAQLSQVGRGISVRCLCLGLWVCERDQSVCHQQCLTLVGADSAPATVPRLCVNSCNLPDTPVTQAPLSSPYHGGGNWGTRRAEVTPQGLTPGPVR